MDGARSYSVAHRAGLLPTELTGMWGWILLRSPHQGRGSPPAPAPTELRPGWPAFGLASTSAPELQWGGYRRSVLMSRGTWRQGP